MAAVLTLAPPWLNRSFLLSPDPDLFHRFTTATGLRSLDPRNLAFPPTI